MDTVTTVDFATAARLLTRAARGRGLVGPGFRCPPRLVGVDRSIRQRPEGPVVAVRLRGRPMPAVLADMIEGVIVANGLRPPAADRLRAELWAAVGADAATPAPMAPTRADAAAPPVAAGRVGERPPVEQAAGVA